MSAFLEIVELVNGDIVLQRAGGEGEALMTIRFSDESKAYLPEERLEVARAMIHAGIESASQIEFVRSGSASFGVEEELGSDALEVEEGDSDEFVEAGDTELLAAAEQDQGLEPGDLAEDRILH